MFARVLFILGVCMVSMSFQVASADLQEGLFSEVYQVNRIRSLLHRWWVFYESASPNFDAQLEMLTDDFALESPLGSSRGKAAYLERARGAVASGARNSHQIEDLRILGREGNLVRAQALLRYQTVNASGVLSSYALAYDLVVEDGAGILPKLKQLKLTPRGPFESSVFVDRYAENRVASLVHYFAAIFDYNSGDATPFYEFFSTPFEFSRGSGAPITQRSEFDSFFAAIPKTTSLLSAHTLEELRVEQGAGQRMNAKFCFKWDGVLVNGARVQARSAHEWELIEGPGRYPILNTVRVRLVDAPRPVPAQEN